ncbi:MAG TPA: transcriptional repressor [Candidatus Omnitrophota bacterium]|nr:transcriptional repressor [Candidatus Omnitrophota bacterium]HPD84683.1 transcriptional repressor [Candidatus Omnitrophota bacterium]HRZ03541.1 transcriptional repressor [Candidatus Omnitrophota bacterium]
MPGNYLKETDQALTIFKDYCKKKQMRYTLERETMIKALYRLEGHFAVDDLLRNIRRHNPKARIAKTSVYRALPFLMDAGLLRESIAGVGSIVYEHTLGHRDHDHLRCLRCGKIVEFYSPDLIGIQTRICRKEQFLAVRRINTVNGYCRLCKDTAG